MTNKRIGEILYNLRTQQKLGQEELCRGLCSAATLSRYELGERVPDRLLLNMLIQRLGKAADKMATILYIEEYQYLLWKKQVLIAVSREDMAALSRLLEEPQALQIKINETLQQQFYFQMKAILADRKEGDVAKSIELLKKAVELTMPGFGFDKMQRYLISTVEMQIILNLAEQMIRGGQEKEAVDLLMEIAEYSWLHYNDKEAKVKIYPKAIKLLAPLLIREKRYVECLYLSQRAIELLRWQGVLYDLAELMEDYLQCCAEGSRGEKEAQYEKQLQALKEVYEEYGVDVHLSENAMLHYGNQEIYLVDEVIKMSRTDRAVSQEILSEDICTPETLSRIESGKRAPNTRNFRALMEKLDVNQDYYNGRLDTDDFLLLESKKELDRAISLRNWKEAHKLLDELKLKLDMNSELNRQTLQADEDSILFGEGKMSAQEFRIACEHILKCEHEGWKAENFWQPFLTDFRVEMLNNIAATYRLDNQKEKAIFIWEHILKQLDKSKVKLSDRYNSSIMVIGNLTLCYGEVGRMKECLEMCEKGISLCFETGRGVRMAKFVGAKAEALYLINKKEACLRYLKQAFYLSDLVFTNKLNEYISNYYIKHYGKETSWY
ncbi:MAG: helix-turn-helix transcriptional regulator [Eubacteriales bacterium]|nr:helix-turn-helix transcriptional regulator [Eubacteriales bacterium]